MGDIRKKQKVKLTFKLEDGSEKSIECAIREVYSDRISLTAPDAALEYAEYLSEGEELIANIFTPVGVKIFSTIVLDSPLEPEFVIEYAEISAEIQRREYVRVPMEAKVVVQRKQIVPHEDIVTSTIDISGGGLRFTYPGDFKLGEEVDITLYLPDMRLIQAKSKIIANPHLPKNVHTLHFIEIDENSRDRIIKTCFDMQTKLLEIE